MAAAQARAAWQRTANRCFVQEDAKGEPKLACCSSSSSSKMQFDASGCDMCNGLDDVVTPFMARSWNPSDSSLSPNTRWWLHSQPNFACSKDFSHEAKLEAMIDGGDIIPASKPNGVSFPGEDTQVDLSESPCSSLESEWQVCVTRMKHDSEAIPQGLKAVNSDVQQSPKHKADTDEFLCPYEDFTDWESVNQLNSYEDACFDLDMPWMKSEKTDPWWRTADKDALVSFVAQKSFKHIENCDLPPPQTMHVKRGQFAGLQSVGDDAVLSSSLDGPALQGMDGEHWPPSESCHSFCVSDRPFSTNSYSTTSKESTENMNTTESDPNKAQLLKALCHSQTRAREAEKGAQQASAEKEHIIKLFFRQASHLFAHKQWLQLLQLESLFLQLRMKDNQKILTFLPGLPQMPLNIKPLRKGVHEVIGRQGYYQNHGFSKHAVVIVVGLGFAGAGLLLGWTIGWLLPF